MTDQELLQQAKEWVANKAAYKGCKDWDSFKSKMNNDGYEMQPFYDAAAIIAIQRAREEAEKEINTLKSKIGNMKASLKKYQRNED